MNQKPIELSIIDAEQVSKGEPIRRTVNVSPEKYEEILREVQENLLVHYPWECYPGSRGRAILAVVKKIDLLTVQSATIYMQGYLPSKKELTELEKNFELVKIWKK